MGGGAGAGLRCRACEHLPLHPPPPTGTAAARCPPLPPTPRTPCPAPHPPLPPPTWHAPAGQGGCTPCAAHRCPPARCATPRISQTAPALGGHAGCEQRGGAAARHCCSGGRGFENRRPTQHAQLAQQPPAHLGRQVALVQRPLLVGQRAEQHLLRLGRQLRAHVGLAAAQQVRSDEVTQHHSALVRGGHLRSGGGQGRARQETRVRAASGGGQP